MPEFISTRLTRLFSSLPPDLELAMIEEVKVNWMEAHHLHAAGSHLPDFPGKAELVSFFSWLDFCDDLVGKSAPAISEAVSADIRENFLEAVLEGRLVEAVQADEEINGDEGNSAEEVRTVQLLELIMQCWTHVKSDSLAAEFANWLFGDGRGPELNGVVTHPLKHLLLRLCNSKRQEATLVALSLLDVFLERPCDPILQVCELREKN